MRFEATLAVRHLRSGGWQTVLIAAGVAVAVTLVLFISGLIQGVQRRFLRILTGSMAHVTVYSPEYEPRTLEQVRPPEGGVAITRQEQRAQRSEEITNWQQDVRELRRFPYVAVVSPAVSGAGVLTRGEKVSGVRVFGADPALQDRVVNLTGDLIEGEYLGLGSEDVVIGSKLADDDTLALGDRVRLTSSRGVEDVFTVRGIFETGQQAIDESWVFINLRPAQSLFATGSAVTAISIKLNDLFAANQVADQIEASLGLRAESWMRNNPNIVSGLRAQSATSLMISGFSLLAAGFAISSVLIVSVLKRSREIGILKSMGARGRQILLVFTLEGIGVALSGSAVGVVAGSGLILALRRIPQVGQRPGRPFEPLLPGIIEWRTILATVAIALVVTIIASVYPARQAARLDPVEVIRGG